MEISRSPLDGDPRLAVTPFVGYAFTPYAANHEALGLAAHARLSRRFWVGASGEAFAPFGTAVVETPHATRLSQLGGVVNLDARTVVFGSHAEGYALDVLGSLGTIVTRPIAVVDPASRTFDYQARLSFGFGAGLRLPLGDWLAATVDVRDTIFIDRRENGVVSEGHRADSDTWYGESALRQVFELRLGLSLLAGTKR